MNEFPCSPRPLTLAIKLMIIPLLKAEGNMAQQYNVTERFGLLFPIMSQKSSFGQNGPTVKGCDFLAMF